ncbi:helix-turn-helix transcriptional regulator [Paenibacillus sedimenti]|uniref:helix-turn-helix transcriptional regulator n=1 Tax=Paenibacillus sedimenti TaxID=2770274 RepID=UPI0035E3CA47
MRGYSQEKLSQLSGVSRNTVSTLCSNTEYVPSGSIMQKILKALREVDPSVRADQFWDL